jgi:hypothetical protein
VERKGRKVCVGLQAFTWGLWCGSGWAEVMVLVEVWDHVEWRWQLNACNRVEKLHRIR